MADLDLVRPSRDGDQFHYLWAARQCLKLLPSDSDLVAITIEGPSQLENVTLVGDQLIDVGAYFGAENFKQARQVHYIQLKHSTRHQDQAWTPSGVAPTIEGFAARFRDLRKSYSADELRKKVRFHFTTNRPIASYILSGVDELARGAKQKNPKTCAKLLRFAGLEPNDVEAFFDALHLTGSEDDLWQQRNILAQEVSGYLPDADYDVPVQLKELVTRKATSEFKENPTIRRHDVLRALKTTELGLFPAERKVPTPQGTLPRDQEGDLIATIRAAAGPVIIHADGGVGKSVLAARIAESMPSGSIAVLYDCFGNGLYRNAFHFRHRHKDALVQIANELAAKGCCHPLIPSIHADPKAYLRAFIYRLEQASTHLRAADPDSLLCLVIDAADNAEMAAQDQREPNAFISDLLGLPLPQGVRLVATCRSHRKELLRAPPTAQEIELRPFSFDETSRHLRATFPSATDDEVTEFAHLSSSNPRVQALALSRRLSLVETLRELGPQPTTVEAAIGELLENAVAKLRTEAGSLEAGQIGRICAGLAVLRPLIPIKVLAAMSGVTESAIRSFAFDLGRPLLVSGDSVQFYDEPAETWFRERFKPKGAELEHFIQELRPLASTNAYVAAALPQLLLDAGHLTELVALALSPDALPTSNPLEKRDVEIQRLLFALKASLLDKRYVEAAKLALKAAGEAAGEQRQNHLVEANTDLAGALLAPDRVEEIVSRRTFGSGWLGSHHAYEACFMSGHPELAAEASSRLRMAYDWLWNWSRLPAKARENEQVTDEDRLELALATLRLRGAKRAAAFLRNWTHRPIAFRVGTLLARRLVDLGQYDLLDTLAVGARNDVWLLLAINHELRRVGRALPPIQLARLIRLLSHRCVRLQGDENWTHQWSLLAAITSAVETALLSATAAADLLTGLLDKYVPSEPPRELSTRFGANRAPLLRAYALQSALAKRRLTLTDLAHPQLRKELEGQGRHSASQETREFQEDVGGLLPWYQLAADLLAGQTTSNQVPQAVSDALEATKVAQRQTWREYSHVSDSLATLWLGILIDAGLAPGTEADRLKSWIESQSTSLLPDTFAALARTAARSGLDEHALDYASVAFKAHEASREDASSRSEAFVQIARAIILVSRPEAEAYFDKGVEIASRIGDENVDRWAALLHLGAAAADKDQARPEAAYRLSRAAELTYEYVARDKHFDWTGTVEALVGLCAPSALTILSRWRDRRFGHAPRLLPIAIDQLVKGGQLTHSDRLIFAGVDAEWSRVRDLKAFLEAEQDSEIRALGAGSAYRYIRLRGGSLEEWQTLKELELALGLDFPDLDRLISRAQDKASTAINKEPSSTGSFRGADDRRAPDWDDLFSGIDLSSSDALHGAFLALRTYDAPYETDRFFSEACLRVAPGHEADFVDAFGRVPEFGIYELDNFLKAMPKGWLNRVALRGSVTKTVLEFCRRDPTRIHRHRWYQSLPFKQLAKDGLVTDPQIVDATLSGLADIVDVLDAGELFGIVGLVAAKLTPAGAHEALGFGLSLLEDILTERDGDGEWRPALAPPNSVLDALSGYIWAGLASPIAALRWEFAHVVRSTVELRNDALTRSLCAFFDQGNDGAFGDQSFVFYRLHAEQWFLLGLARASSESPVIPDLVPALLKAASSGHVVIQDLAAQTLHAMVHGGLTLPASDLTLLAGINHAVNPARVYEHYGERYRLEENEADQPEEDDVAADEKYYFGIDIGPYWFAPLGRCFGVPQSEIERRARAVLRERFGMSGSAETWRDDERHKRRLFEDSETHHSHGSMPDTDDARTYRAYHSMMIVASQLLRDCRVYQEQGSSRDEFREWLEDHLLTRKDGRWLSDRRDPVPVPDAPKPEGYGDKSWRWAVSKTYLEAALATDEGFLTLWGHWNTLNDGRDEDIKVQSALISDVGAEALLSSLQTAEDLSEFWLPDINPDPDHVLSHPPLSMRGWVCDESWSKRLDNSDDWGKDIRYPSPKPSSEIVDKLLLVSDAEQRVWTSRLTDQHALRSETWIKLQGWGREIETEAGSRLSGTPEFLRALLEGTSECLVLSVAIRRTARRSSYSGESDGTIDYPNPYKRYFLVKSDGILQSL